MPEGLSKLEFGIEKYRQTGAQLFEASSLALLAEGYRRGGRLEEALQATSRALERGELAEGYFYAAEIHRIRGKLLVEARADEAGAEAAFRQAIAIANAQQALSLELRAATDLSELLVRQGRAPESREILSDVLDRFGTASDTADYTRAREALSS